jgi:helicase required for RNAi-mediated heterochromatin assembly 1
LNQLREIPTTPLINRALPVEEEELGYAQVQERSTELTEGQDFANEDAPQDEWIPFRRRLTGRNVSKIQLHESKIKKLLRSNSNLNHVPKELRGEVYRYWEEQVNEIVLQKLRDVLPKYEQHVKDYQVVKGVCSWKLMQHLSIKVIACTTTGLSKYRGLISAMRPRTLLVEEAAETGEGSIISGLVETLEQLILVGDHQQLQARCSVRALEEAPFHLKVSMFERLVNNGFPFTMLNKQRRMIPTIRKLLCIEPNPFYRNLQDHESVLDRVRNRPPIPGMGGKDVYLFHHNWPEARNAEYSCFNFDEAQMIVGFFRYLILNGVDRTKITVLTVWISLMTSFTSADFKPVLSRSTKSHP